MHVAAVALRQNFFYSWEPQSFLFDQTSGHHGLAKPTRGISHHRVNGVWPMTLPAPLPHSCALGAWGANLRLPDWLDPGGLPGGWAASSPSHTQDTEPGCMGRTKGCQALGSGSTRAGSLRWAEKEAADSRNFLGLFFVAWRHGALPPPPVLLTLGSGVEITRAPAPPP